VSADASPGIRPDWAAGRLAALCALGLPLPLRLAIEAEEGRARERLAEGPFRAKVDALRADPGLWWVSRGEWLAALTLAATSPVLQTEREREQVVRVAAQVARHRLARPYGTVADLLSVIAGRRRRREDRRRGGGKLAADGRAYQRRLTARRKRRRR
jgi:hypothetical protein